MDALVTPALGNYADVVYALRVVSGILNSSEFTILLVCSVSLAIIIPLLRNVFRAFQTGKADQLFSWNWVWGILVYIFFIQSTATVIVEDKDYGSSPTYGMITTINEVPLAPALFAWLYGNINDIFTSLISTHGAPILEFGDIRNDVSYKLLTETQSLNVLAANIDPFLGKNIKEYMDNCLLPGTNMGRIDIKDISDSPGAGASLWEAMKFDGNVYTMNFSSPAGNIATACSDAHDAITTAFQVAEPAIMKAYCDSFNINEVVCKDAFEKLSFGLLGKASKEFTLDFLAASAAESTVTGYMENSDRKISTQFATSAIQAEKWVPALRSIVYVVFLLFTPVIFLFTFISPGGALKYYAGIIAWLIVWAVTDQLLFCKYQTDLYNLFKHMRTAGMGIDAMLDVPSSVMNNVGQFGKMRWATATVSAGFCMALGLGNHAMANFAQDLGGAVQNVTNGIAGALSGFGGTAAARDAMIREEARGMAASQMFDEQIANDAGFNYLSGIENAAAMTGAYGSVGAATTTRGRDGAVSAQQQTGGTDYAVGEADALGMSLQEYGAFSASGRLVTDENREQLSNALGGAELREGMQLSMQHDGDGTFSNIKATEQNFTTDDGLSGTMTTYFGDDGKMDRAEFFGTDKNGKTSIVWDENGKVYESSQKGYNHSYEAFTSSKVGSSKEFIETENYKVGKDFDIGKGSMEAMLRGDMDDTVGKLAFSDKDLGHAMVAAQAQAMAQYFSQSISSGSSLEGHAGGSLGVGSGGGEGSPLAKLSAQLGFSLSANASDAETINMATVAYHAKYDEIFNSSLSLSGKIAAWESFSAGNMGYIAEASGDTKLERLTQVVADNVESGIDFATPPPGTTTPGQNDGPRPEDLGNGYDDLKNYFPKNSNDIPRS